MKRLGLLCVLLAVAAGCGGGGKQATTTSAPQISGGLTGLPHSKDCDKKGISSSAAAEGTCLDGSTTVRVVDKAHVLHMKPYDAQFVAVRTASHLGRRAAENFQRGGEFVIATLRVRNTDTVAHALGRTSRLAYLLAGGSEFPEIPGAEAQLHDSLSAAGAVAPGKDATGTVVFDPPKAQAAGVGGKESYLVFLDLAEQPSGPPAPGSTVLGFMRLWK